MLATLAVVTSITLSAISASLSRVMELSAEANTIRTFPGRRFRNNSRRKELASAELFSKKLLHSSEKLSGFTISQLLSADQLLDLLLCRGGSAFDELGFESIIGVVCWRLEEEVPNL